MEGLRRRVSGGNSVKGTPKRSIGKLLFTPRKTPPKVKVETLTREKGDLEREVALLREENERMRTRVAEMKAKMKGKDEELEGLRREVQALKEEKQRKEAVEQKALEKEKKRQEVRDIIHDDILIASPPSGKVPKAAAASSNVFRTKKRPLSANFTEKHF